LAGRNEKLSEAAVQTDEDVLANVHRGGLYRMQAGETSGQLSIELL
jgi:hypothetical protein